MRFFIFIFFFLFSLTGWSQIDFPQSENAQSDSINQNINYAISDQKAKQAVGEIMRYTGLPQNFIVIEEAVKTAVAYNKNKERYIGYNKDFMRGMYDNTNTNWSAVSILAHEIAHHLAGHTLNVKNSNPGNELEADVFSGFILYRMGATLNEAMIAMKEFKSDTTDKRYPPKNIRLKAIQSGWLEAEKLTNCSSVVAIQSPIDDKIEIQYEMIFNGDNNIYYINTENQVIWYNNYGFPIIIGKITTSTSKGYSLTYSYHESYYDIDFKGKIWFTTTHGAVIKAGQVYGYSNN